MEAMAAGFEKVMDKKAEVVEIRKKTVAKETKNSGRYLAGKEKQLP